MLRRRAHRHTRPVRRRHGPATLPAPAARGASRNPGMVVAVANTMTHQTTIGTSSLERQGLVPPLRRTGGLRALLLAGGLLLGGVALGGCATGAGFYGPDMVAVSPGVQVIADYDEPIFYADGFYWANRGGAWYRSSYYTGGWIYYARPPGVIVSIHNPHAYRHYRPHGWAPRGGGRHGHGGGGAPIVRGAPPPRAAPPGAYGGRGFRSGPPMQAGPAFGPGPGHSGGGRSAPPPSAPRPRAPMMGRGPHH